MRSRGRGRRTKNVTVLLLLLGQLLVFNSSNAFEWTPLVFFSMLRTCIAVSVNYVRMFSSLLLILLGNELVLPLGSKCLQVWSRSVTRLRNRGRSGSSVVQRIAKRHKNFCSLLLLFIPNESFVLNARGSSFEYRGAGGQVQLERFNFWYYWVLSFLVGGRRLYILRHERVEVKFVLVVGWK
jgi:hypothetical protein